MTTKKAYAAKRKAGMCTRWACEEKAYFDEDKQKQRGMCLKHLVEQSNRRAKRKQALKDNGQCVSCGHLLSPALRAAGEYRCDDCRKTHNNYMRATHIRLHKKGLCRICRKPTSLKANGKHYILCEEHRQWQAERDEKRAAKAKRDRDYAKSVGLAPHKPRKEAS